MEVLRLPPYHCELNAIELIWADEKNFVAREIKEMTIEHVETLFREKREAISAETCKNCIKHARFVEEEYWKTDRIMDIVHSLSSGRIMDIVHSLSSGKVEMFLCAAFHAFTPHVNVWKL